MQANIETSLPLHNFSHLPAFIRYILDNRLLEFVKLQIQLTKELNLPALKFFTNYSEDDLIEYMIESNKTWMTLLAENKVEEQIHQAIETWKRDEIKQINKFDITGEDIALIYYIRKRIFIHFVKEFCNNDIDCVLELINEIDLMISASENASNTAYIDLLEEKINRELLLNEKIANTSPCMIYLFNLQKHTFTYGNSRISDFFGQDIQMLKSYGKNIIAEFTHPDDLEKIAHVLQQLEHSTDSDIHIVEHRLKNKEGNYIWHRNYITVFKYDNKGKPLEIIGNTLDIHREKEIAENLEESELLLKQAQKLSNIGNYILNLNNNRILASDEFYKIYELDKSESINYAAIKKLRHPDDYDYIEETTQKSFANKLPFTMQYRIVTPSGKQKVVFAKGEPLFDEEGEFIKFHGTIQDVTDRQDILEQLRISEERFKQAEALTHIGNYEWNLETDELVWSDELYRIYGLDPATAHINGQNILAFIHPEDIAYTKAAIRTSIKERTSHDIYYRIELADKTEKILHLRGDIICNANNKPVKIIGTAQDVTEKQTLISQLKEKESIYKQTEILANMGNYAWNLVNGDITWTDQLYKIYGLEPQSEPITIKKFISFVHPEDKEYVENGLNDFYSTKTLDYTFRIITKNGEVRLVRSIAQLFTDKKGAPVKVIGTEQDVTERQHIIQQLQKSQQIYRQAEELANMGNWFWNKDENVLEWTDQLYKIYGLKPQSEQITIERFLSFVHPEDRPAIAESINKDFTEDSIDYTFRIITADGQQKILRSIAHAQHDSKGKLISISGTEQDITENQKLVKELKQKEQLYKQAQALAHVGNWSWSIKDNVVEWSDELYRIYGVSPETGTITYEEYLRFIHPIDFEKVTSQIESALKNHQSWNYNHHIIRSDGSVRIINATGEVILDKEGTPYLMVGTAQDITEKQTLIEELEYSEALYKQAQSIAHLGNWTFNVETKDTIWSEELYKIYEIPVQEKVTFDEFLSFIHPDDKQDVLDYFDYCITHKVHYDKRHRVILNNGKVKTLQRRGELKLDVEGNVKLIIGTTQDITEQVFIENELRENQNFIQKITDATPSIISSYNIHTRKYSFVSKGLSKLLGYNSVDALQQGEPFFINLTHPADKEMVIETRNNLIDLLQNEGDGTKSEVVELTYRMQHKNGEYRWLHTYETVFDRNANGEVENILNITLDVTEQYAATQKIKEQEHFIQHIADASPTVLYVFDIEKQSIAYVNREIFFVLGYTPEDILKLNDTVTDTMYHPDDLHLLPERVQSGKKIKATDIMIQYECRIKNSSNEWQWFLVREVVFKTDDKGKIIQIIGAALDISKRKEMEKTLLQNSFQLEQSNASLEEFAYVASHDLKEPLRKISTFGDRLITTQIDNLTPDGKIYLKKIVDASQRMQTMISDLLSISMISGNKQFEEFSLQKVLDETLQTLEFKIEQKNAIIHTDGLPVATIVPSQFRQLFQNLLSNSLKFIGEDVQPVINITHSYLKPEDVAHYGLSNAEKFLKIEFADNGIGFENEYAGKIFAIFQRLHGRSEYEGSGIGLAICKKIVEHHRGVIYASGIMNEGATFTIILPL